MARYTGPKTKISRKFGEPILGNGKWLTKTSNPPGQHGADGQERAAAAVLVDDEDDDQRQAGEERQQSLGADEAVGQKLGGAVERGHASGGGQADRKRGSGCVAVGGRGVLERQ